ncbi:rod shape-determining protein RodA [Parasynechococcus sp.]|uniref:rod shape-determining protein RodA n=1 Tax=Parasynechococcus sp. TaxID=3101203 RepID=UPI0037041D69
MLSRRRRRRQQREWILWGVPLAMVAIAGVLIASTQRQADYADWYDHWFTAFGGVVIALILQRLPLQRLQSLLMPLYGLTVISLIAVRLIGTTALGAQRWISIGGIHVQPSEFAKIAVILLVAAVLERHPVERPIDLLRPLGVIAVPWLLVFIQPDLGTSLVFGALMLTMLYWSGMPVEWVILLLSPLLTVLLSLQLPWDGLQTTNLQSLVSQAFVEQTTPIWIALVSWSVFTALLAFRSLPWRRLSALAMGAIQISTLIVSPILWGVVLQDYQRDRLLLFLDPSKDPLGGGYHLLQSTVGIGSGGLFGTGLLQGQLTKLRFIPEQHTDFIFSALGEETGFLGCLLVIVGFALLMGRLLQVARHARSDFESLVVIGIGTMIMFQVVVNIFMTIGLGPVTGIPLPFLSYGRSAMVVNFIALGLCLSVVKQSRRLNILR